jgi:hypothetical protein
VLRANGKNGLKLDGTWVPKQYHAGE